MSLETNKKNWYVVSNLCDVTVQHSLTYGQRMLDNYLTDDEAT